MVGRHVGQAPPSITLHVYSHAVTGTDEKAAQVMQTAFAPPR